MNYEDYLYYSMHKSNAVAEYEQVAQTVYWPMFDWIINNVITRHFQLSTVYAIHHYADMW